MVVEVGSGHAGDLALCWTDDDRCTSSIFAFHNTCVQSCGSNHKPDIFQQVSPNTERESSIQSELSTGRSVERCDSPGQFRLHQSVQES